MPQDAPVVAGHELVLTRVIDAPRAAVFKAWTDPEILKRWWAPRPYTTPSCQMDLRPGGVFSTLMRSAEGVEFDNVGVFLEIIPGEKIVFTDAFRPGWIPAEKPFMTAIVTFRDAEPGKTRYVARALHWSAADRETHEKMGFHEGWGMAADQLAEVAAGL
ncbi:MAG TPA: SRPBCC family protein [Phenylobacterium sp.]|nr:SRPBCC family protein [Phenylobacterium sp.]